MRKTRRPVFKTQTTENDVEANSGKIRSEQLNLLDLETHFLAKSAPDG